MRVLCCHTELRPETVAALERFANGHDVEIVDVRGSDRRYHETLDRFWAEGAAFALVEHDVVIDDRVMPVFNSCPEPWCSFVGELSVGYTGGWLGCVRFSTALLQAEPDAMRLAGEPDSSCAPTSAWYRIDVRLDRILRDRGYLPHVHGRVGHLNPVSKLADPDGAYIAYLEKHGFPAHA